MKSAIPRPQEVKMRFKLKELLIQIAPEGGIGAGVWGLPGGACDSPSCVYCSGSPSACRIHGSVPVHCFDTGALDPNPLQRLNNLRVLKAQLTEHLAAVEAAERTTSDSLEPKTREEMETLEHHLETALEEVRSRKAKLARPRSKGSKTSEKQKR
jgi:hypothetical protein